MEILVLNQGSSSIKCALYRLDKLEDEAIPPLWHAEVKGGIEELVREKKIDVVGHRIVHGGDLFHHPVLITSEVKKKIKSLAELAPLHQGRELEGIENIEKLLPNVPQVAVFDTSFHRTLPLEAKIYPGPYKWFEEGIQRFGFHGISYQYCMKRAANLVKRPKDSLKMVICHLGSGASLCAIENRKSIDTTMGYTPLDGLMMDTRPGSLDPAIVLHLIEKKNMSPEAVSKELYFSSGLLGISGKTGDMKEIIQGNEERSKLALDIYLHRLNQEIGAMIASLSGIDLLVFTGGIGENAPLIREKVADNFSFLGLKLDKAKNQVATTEDQDLSVPDSSVKVLLIHTQEAFQIALECYKLTLTGYASL